MSSLLDRTTATALKAWRPPTKIKPSEFADEQIVVTSGPLAGTRWHTQPFQREPMDAFEQPGVEVVVLMWSSQVGKTSSVLCLVGYHMAHDPCAILVVNPTIDPMARAFARERLDPMIRASPTLSAVVDQRRSADGTNTTLSKTFRGGILALAGANSPASLAARAIRLLVEDEIDRYPAEISTEGKHYRCRRA